MRKKLFILLVCLLTLPTPCFSTEKNGKINEEKSDKSIANFYQKLFSADYQGDKSLLFSNDFLEKIPYEKIAEILKVLFTNTGKYKGYTNLKETGKIKLLFEKGTCESLITLNGEGKVTTIWFGQPEIEQSGNIEEVIVKFKKLEGEKSFLIRKNGQKLFAHNEKTALAVGSAFKLFVLKALVDRIKNGQDNWETATKLDKNKFSLPSGFLQTWPDKDPITLATLANLMISISDNTATDLLIDHLGRENIEKLVTDKNKPFLKTLEMFKLKILKEEGERYIGKNVRERRRILEDLQNYSIEEKVFPTEPTMIDQIEWFFSSEELCQTIEELKGIPAIGISDSGLVGKKWDYIGFKGGSEPGVLNLTYVFEKKGNNYSFSLTINNSQKEIDESEVFTIVSEISAILYQQY